MATVSNTITLQVAPIGNKYEVRLWVATESIRVQHAGTREAAMGLARTIQSELKGCLCAEILVVEKHPEPKPAGASPELFPA